MSHYVHHVPGRLRVKSPLLKRQDRLAEEVRNHVSRLEGVTEVEVSTLTGSAVVRYDSRRVDSRALLDSLRDLGLMHHGAVLYPAPADATGPLVAGSPFTHRIADTLFNKLVETAIERSAMALIAAVI